MLYRLGFLEAKSTYIYISQHIMGCRPPDTPPPLGRLPCPRPRWGAASPRTPRFSLGPQTPKGPDDPQKNSS